MLDRLFSSAGMYFSACVAVILMLCLGMVMFTTTAPVLAPALFTEYLMSTYLLSFAGFLMALGVFMVALWVFVEGYRGVTRPRMHF